MMQYEPEAGESIYEAATKLVKLAVRGKALASMSFNGIELKAAVDATADDVVRTYFKATKERCKENTIASKSKTDLLTAVWQELEASEDESDVPSQNIVRLGEALVRMGKILADEPVDDARRVIKAVAILQDIQLHASGRR